MYIYCVYHDKYVNPFCDYILYLITQRSRFNYFDFQKSKSCAINPTGANYRKVQHYHNMESSNRKYSKNMPIYAKLSV